MKLLFYDTGLNERKDENLNFVTQLKKLVCFTVPPDQVIKWRPPVQGHTFD